MKQLKISLQFIWQQIHLRLGFIIIYALLWLAISVMFASIYPFLAENAESITAAVQAFEGTGLAEAFGITDSYVSSIQNFVGGEQLITFSMVSTGVAVFLGAASIGGAIRNKQIFAFLTKPISRSQLYFLHFLTNSITILILNSLVMFITWASFSIFVPDEAFDEGFILSTFLGFTVINLLFLSFGHLFSLLIGSFRTIIFGIFLGIFGQILDGLSAIDDFHFIAKLFNPYYYLNTSRITEEATLDSADMLILVLITSFFFTLGIFLFRRKEIYL